MEGTKMGTYDFTYNVPANFNRRVVQFLQQFGKAHVAQAFQRCEYEYEDLGLAFYAGMKGDNWNKNALDFTFEGAESDIALLQSFDSVLQDAIGKALKPSESGLLVRKVYYFASDSASESTMIPPSNEERLNALERQMETLRRRVLNESQSNADDTAVSAVQTAVSRGPEAGSAKPAK